MASWGNTDDAANSVLYVTLQVNKTSNTVNQATLYGNSTVGAWYNGTSRINAAIGQFGVSPSEIQNARANSATAQPQHAGWVVRTVFTGPVARINVVAGGTGYNNTDVASITTPAGSLGTVNAAATISTNSTGGIVSLTITNQGSGYTSTTLSNSSFVIANSTGGSTGGAGAQLTANVGGRAGRQQAETLIAMSSITGDGDGNVFP